MARGQCLLALAARGGLRSWQGRPLPVQSVRRFTNTRSVRESVPLSNVRNLGIIAHIDAGKTTTTERMLHYAGFTRKIGDVDDGDTVMDYLPAERSRGITIQSAAITFGWRDKQFHLIDTPGHVDFTVEVERAMRVLDGAVVIVDAVAGVQAQTQTVWRQARRYGIPVLAFVNKMDREGANWEKCAEDVETKLGARPLVLQLPEYQKTKEAKYEAGELESWLDVVSLERITFDISQDNTGASIKREKLSPDEDAFKRAAEGRVQLVETLAELDTQIVDVFLSSEVDGDHLRVPEGQLHQAIRRVVLASQACPVLLGASFRNVGVQPLLDAIVDYLPAPTDRPTPLAVAANAAMKKEVQVHLDPREKLVAFAFKVIVDQQRGPMVFVRVYSGELDARMTLVNGTQGGVKERATKLLQMYADLPEEIQSIGCGHIGVILGLKKTKTGDTLLHPKHPSLSSDSHKGKKGKSQPASPELGKVGLQLHGISVPPPVFFCSVEADSPQDEKPLEDALANMLLEDPSLHVSYDEETGQTLLSGMGELHLEIVRDRLLNDQKVNASFGTMRVSYRETPGQEASATYEYSREVAGKVSQASMRVTVSPVDADEAEGHGDGNVVEVDVPADLAGTEGGSAAKSEGWEVADMAQMAIDDSIRNSLYRGTLLGFPVARTRVRVSDVGYFGRDISTPAAYRACASQALFRALSEASPSLLEPIAKITVHCPNAHIGSVLSDLNGVRKGQVQSLDDADADAADQANATKVLIAEVPLSTMVGYSSALRSLTAGSGTFTMEVSGFGPMTAQQQQQIVKESRGYYTA